MYAIGKGTSSTTVEAPLTSVTAVTAGDTMIIQGTVIDVSPGTKQANAELRFPKGVPTISDVDQGSEKKKKRFFPKTAHFYSFFLGL